jgi:hypothetical protein
VLICDDGGIEGIGAAGAMGMSADVGGDDRVKGAVGIVVEVSGTGVS